MARAPKSIREKYFSPFPVALRGLMERHPVTTQEKLATITGKKRQTISQYVNGTSEPGYDTLTKIADYFNVSIDYLLGRSNDPSPVSSSVDELGLTTNAVAWLKKIKQENNSDHLSQLFEDCNFQQLVANFIDYAFIYEAETAVNRIYDKYFPRSQEGDEPDFDTSSLKFEEELECLLNKRNGHSHRALRMVREFEGLMIDAGDSLFECLCDEDCVLCLSEISAQRITRYTNLLLEQIRARIINKDIKQAFSQAIQPHSD